MARNRGGRPRKPRPWTDDVRTVRVHSCADGSMKVEPAWLHEPVEFGATPVGLPTRMAFATFCEKAINDALEAERGTHG